MCAPNREYARLSLLHPSGSRHVLSLLLAAPMLASLAVPAARAQPNLLMPPSLPSTLPGGQPLPGALSGGLPELRALLRRTQDAQLYLPAPGSAGAWARCSAR